MSTDFATALPAAAATLEARVTALEQNGCGGGAGNLRRKAITAPAVTHGNATRAHTVHESEARMNIWVNAYVGPSPAENSGNGGGNLHHVDWSINYTPEAAKHLDVSAIKLYGSSDIENAVLQTSALKPGDGGFTATFLLQDGTYDVTIDIDATPDIDYQGQLQMIYSWTITNNNLNSMSIQITAIDGIVVLEHIVTVNGVEVHFDFGSEAFSSLDDFELYASVKASDAGIEVDGDTGFAGTIIGSKRSMQTEVTFHITGGDIGGVFMLFPPLVIPTAWNGSVATLAFFSGYMNSDEVWDLVKLIAGHMIIQTATKNEVEEETA